MTLSNIYIYYIYYNIYNIYKYIIDVKRHSPRRDLVVNWISTSNFEFCKWDSVAA